MLDYKPRIEDRTKVMICARLRGAGPERDVCIVDISTRGLAATAENPPRRGDFVELVVGDNRLVGQVKWSSMRRFGLSLRQRISVVALLSGDGEAVTLAAREAASKQAARKRNRAAGSAGIVRKIEFALIFCAGAVATFIVAGYAGEALGSLDQARVAMGGRAAP